MSEEEVSRKTFINMKDDIAAALQAFDTWIADVMVDMQKNTDSSAYGRLHLYVQRNMQYASLLRDAVILDEAVDVYHRAVANLDGLVSAMDEVSPFYANWTAEQIKDMRLPEVR